MENLHKIHGYLNYYRNLYFTRSILRGILMFLILILASGLLILLTDLAIHFSGFFLKFVKYLFWTFSFVAFFFFIFRPLLFWIFNIGPYNKLWVAKKIGTHDSAINDRLVNILELENQRGNQSLIAASLQQKIRSVDLSQFNSFFSFKNLLQHFIGFLLLFGIAIIFYLFSPEEIKYASSRIFPLGEQNTKLPYDIKLLNEDLSVDKGANFTLNLKISGHIKPEVLKIKHGSSTNILTDSSSHYSYTFKNVQDNIQFSIFNQEFNSQLYTLQCIPVPVLQNISIQISPPAYTGLERQSLSGSGNFTFPYGSNVLWNVDTYDTDSLMILLNELRPMVQSNDNFSHEQRLLQELDYAFVPINAQQTKRDTLRFKAQMIPDQYPKISLYRSQVDVLGEYVFQGQIQDDYGFHRFHFVIEANDTTIKTDIPLLGKNLNQEFSYGGQLEDYNNIIQNQKVEIYLLLSDNDPFYPYKKVKSNSLFAQLPDEKKVEAIEQEKVNELKNKLDFGKEILDKISKEQRSLRKKLLNKDLGKWERKQLANQIENANKEINQLQKQVNQLREELKKFQNKDLNKDLVQKKLELEKMLKKLMDEELEKLMDELKKLQDELLKNQEPNTDNFEYSMENLQKELDRNLEMLKRYEVEKDQQQVIDKLKELSKKLNNPDSLIQKEGEQTDSLKKEMQETFEKHEQNLEKNKELSAPYDLEDFKQQKRDINKKSENWNQDQDLQNSESNPSEELNQLANEMMMNMQSAKRKQQGEDATMIRQLLETLLQFSYQQESLIEKFNNRGVHNFNQLRREQVGLKERFSTAEDSLQALMERNSMVASAIGNQIGTIETHFQKIRGTFKQERFTSISIHQQRIMQSTNELILMLNESLDNMNSSMSGQGGQKSGKKTKPGMGGLKKQQQSFKDALQKMIDELKKGSQSGKGKQGMSKQLSKMLSQQEKMQKLLQQLMQSGGVGQQSKQILKEINRMVDQNIDDILKRDIDDNMLKRQQRIMTRMLEAEKAEEEREKEKKRESEKPNNYEISNPDEKYEYKRDRNSKKGILYKQDLPLKYFFQRKYDKYLNEIEKY